jgi:hypothetical protein
MYEHQIHKKYGFAEAKNKTLILSKAAFKGECENLHISKTKEYVALIPFYGGLPPGVTKDLTVKSIGQGNSLVSPVCLVTQTTLTTASSLTCAIVQKRTPLTMIYLLGGQLHERAADDGDALLLPQVLRTRDHWRGSR